MRHPSRSSFAHHLVKALLAALVAVLSASSLAGCASPDAPTVAGSVAIVTASHDDELAPTLSPSDFALLGAHARSARARDDAVSAYLIGADSAETTRIDLAPRRPNGQI